MKKLLLTLTFLGLMSGYASAQTFTASATISKDIAITQVTALNFGGIKAATTGNTVIVASPSLNNVTLSSGTGTLVRAGTVGSFSLTGDASTSVKITVTGDTNLVNGANNLGVSAWTNNSVGGVVILSALGAGTVRVGATLTVPQLAPVGVYSGSYTITAAY